MIPWLLITELLSTSDMSLRKLVKSQFDAFPSSGENNFKVQNADTAIEKVLKKYSTDAKSIDKTDGVSLSFEDWRFNLRKSNNEPLVRLNIEAKGNKVNIQEKLDNIKSLII